MMMTQSYYCADHDTFTRSNLRAPAAAHYERSVPYQGYYEPLHQDYRPEYIGQRTNAQTVVHEQGPENGPPGQSRRRIQVACARCRRRKIKCSGDQGDGQSCSACRAAGVDRTQCHYIRVGSHQITVPSGDMMLGSSGVQSGASSTAATYGTDATNSGYEVRGYHNAHRPSLPMLPTRTAVPEYDSYNTSPLDEYAYPPSAISRQQSLSTTYGAENFRPFTTGSVSTPVTSTSLYYEPGSVFSCGNLSAGGPIPGTSLNRLPSVTADAYSSLNMTALHSSLPTQTAQERRLPAPYSQTYQQQQQQGYMPSDVPLIRPLGSFSEPQTRQYLHGYNSRNGMSWSEDTAAGVTTAHRNSSISALPSTMNQQQVQHTSQQMPSGLPMISSSTSISTSLPTDPILGYQFTATSGSPESPTAGPGLSESFSSTSGSSIAVSTAAADLSIMPPPSNTHYPFAQPSFSTPTSQDEPSTRPPYSSTRRNNTASSLFSYSSGASEEASPSKSRRIVRGSSCSDEGQVAPTINHGYASALRHHQQQPQHAASYDGLRRRSSYDHQQTTTTRISVSNLNGHY